jgi:hypothetical protein
MQARILGQSTKYILAKYTVFSRQALCMVVIFYSRTMQDKPTGGDEMARWIDGNPKVRAAMVAKQDLMEKAWILSHADTLKAEAQQLAWKVAEMEEDRECDTMTPAQEKVLARRLKSNIRDIDEKVAALKRVGIDFTPTYNLY